MSSERAGSAESFQPTAAVAALIRSQPVLHHRQTRSSTEKLPAYSPIGKTLDERSSRHSVVKLPTTTTMTMPKKKNGRFLPYVKSRKRPKFVAPRPQRSEIEDRIHSAQQQKLHQLQSRLNELRRQLEREQEENRTLRIIQKREERALKKYEDQEYDVHRVARDFTREIRDVKEEIDQERQLKTKLQTQVEEQENQYQEQRKQIRRFEKLVNEVELLEPNELEEKLKKLTRKLNQIEEKIESKEKQIEKLERNYRNEIQDELVKQRDLKRELDRQARDYRELLLKVEEKNRQVGTMHIYIQRGGRRPSHQSVTLSKSYSLQSLHEASPRFREKMLEYDKIRREQEKRKPKPKPKPKVLPAIPKAKTPPPVVKKKFVPHIEQHPAMIRPRMFDHSKSPNEFHFVDSARRLGPLFLEEKGPLRRQPSAKSNVDDDTTYQSTMAQSPTPSPTLPGIQHPEQLNQARIHRRPSSPLIPPQTAPTHLNKQAPLPPLGKQQSKDDTHTDKWFDLLDLDTGKDDLITNLVSHEPQTKKVAPSPPAQQPNLIMFEPSTISSNGHAAKKPWAPSTKSVDRPRDETFFVTETTIEPLDSMLFGPTSRAKELPALHRPKLAQNNLKPIASRDFVEDLE